VNEPVAYPAVCSRKHGDGLEAAKGFLVESPGA